MTNNSQPKTAKSLLRMLLIIAGTVFVGLGIFGIFVPVLPTTPFLLLAAICYARSSSKLYDWLLTNQWFGRYIKNYLQRKGIPARIKAFALTLLWITISLSAVFAVQSNIIRAILFIIAAGVTAHILLVPTLKK